jgi:adenylate cyclase
MKLSNNLKSNLLHIFYTFLFWLFATYFFAFVRNFGLVKIDESGVAVRVVLRPWRVIILEATVASIILGVSYGFLDIILNREIFRKKPYGFIILIKAITYFLISVIVIGVLLTIVIILTFGLDSLSIAHFEAVIPPRAVLVILSYILVCSFLINSFNQINQKFGPGVFSKLLLGKYYRPKEEEKIFMFVDMKSSTTYAERLGHIKFSEVIQDCFFDLTDVVRRYKANIYKYVGDEVILFWDLKDGLEEANCIKTLFEFQQAINKKTDYYQERYDFVPEFKAGINVGLITVAEVGEIKKEIEHHGDVLNTAARIQSLCNKYSKKLLASESIVEKLDNDSKLRIESQGSILLKGKEHEVKIYSIEM